MIKNERQYQITKVQANRFHTVLRQLENELSNGHDMHPRLVQARKDAVQSQITDLEDQLREYEYLKTGAFDFEQLRWIADLPTLLIKARIARGLSQRGLATRLGLKEQQIQRYEATDYSSASLARVEEVAMALDVDIGRVIQHESAKISLRSIVDGVAGTGLTPEFIYKRLVPRQRTSVDWVSDENGSFAFTLAAAETIAKIFEFPVQRLLNGDPLQLRPSGTGARFKVVSNAKSNRLLTYTAYAKCLAELVVRASPDSTAMELPIDPSELREQIATSYGSLHLDAIVKYLWDLGIAVLPLDDPGAFQGACFRMNFRNVIVLKQRSLSESRWAFDVLHEYWHAVQEPYSSERTVVDSSDDCVSAVVRVEEKTANNFAAAVLLGGKGHSLAHECILAAGSELRLLKGVVRRIAAEAGVPADSLANYIAYRLAAEQGVNWWGTANTFQTLRSPWKVVRSVFFARTEFPRLPERDRQILSQALVPWQT